MHGLGPTRSRVLSLLQSTSGPLTVGAVANQLDLHKNSARFHLDALVEAGFAERATQSSGRTGRPPLLYSATSESPTIGNQHLLELANVLLGEFVAPESDGTERARHAGRTWGAKSREPEQLDLEGLKTHLGQRGFGVAQTSDGLAFTRCPFRDVIDAEQLPLVCSVHQGLLDGITEGSRFTVGRLEVGPRVCRATLTVDAQ
ncbi:helix-turn-helix domain-containing protein [Tessaracoccus lubricantis]|uniref:Helix-turn-helix domain-containing protein n=1 Tax=Tessaracoccus lubricantis TaxID=545543 RepID=A0ABP9F0X6_9ACTN